MLGEPRAHEMSPSPLGAILAVNDSMVVSVGHRVAFATGD
jgi:hypothetical protein